MPTTSNFGWTTPADTDLVKDGAAAIRTLGNGIDTSLVDLKGGTTGQVLSKASNTDLDYTWVTTDDANAIQNAIVDAKGDLIAASAADTPARLAVGNNGETLVADSSASVGLSYKADFAAGKNKIINGDFSIWQRGTSFTSPTVGSFSADRWRFNNFDIAPTTYSVEQQTFTPGTAPVAGYEGTYFLRSTITTVGSNTAYDPFAQRIEDVRTFAGQTVTLSFWAKADSARTAQIQIAQNFGSGGSATVTVTAFASNNFSVTTAWQRFTVTVAIPSISGKTIGTGSFLLIVFRQASASGSVLDLWGVQLEAGSVATAFQTATGTLAGELAACQRYYYLAASGSGQLIGNGLYVSATQFSCLVPLPVTMRGTPTLSVVTGSNYYDTYNGASDLLDSLTIFGAGTKVCGLYNNTEAAGTQYRPAYLETNNAAAFVAFTAEL